MKKEIDLRIDPSLDIPDEVITVHKNLPVHPSYTIITGAPKSGKTLMITNLVHKLKKVFKGRIIVFSNTYSRTLGSLEKTCKAKMFDSLLDDNGQDRIHKIMNFQKARKEAGLPLEPVLIIFDDFCDDKSFNKRQSSMATIFQRGRHNSISIIVASQNYNQIPLTIRKLAQNVCLFKAYNPKERHNILEEQSGWMNESQLESLMDNVWRTKHNFITLYHNELKVLRNFEDVIYQIE